MKTKLQHNRRICAGDTGEEPKSAYFSDLEATKTRIFGWSDKLLVKIATENLNPMWRKAAQDVLDGRGVKLAKSTKKKGKEKPAKKSKAKSTNPHAKAAGKAAWAAKKSMGLSAAQKRWVL